MDRAPSMQLLVSGIVRVASTLLGIVILGIALDLLLNLMFNLPIHRGELWQLFGFIPLSLGLALEALGTHAFWKHGAGTPHPEGHPEQLVTQGPYAWSRHPLYLARHLMLVGAAWLFASLSILVLTTLLFLLVQRIMIPREEARLAARFGNQYEEYRRQVSKWVTLRRRN